MNKHWPKEVYLKVSILDLILVALFSLGSNTKNSFEVILKKCFDLFPEKFSFSELKFPDARKIDRPLRTLRNQRLIKGDPQELYSLTSKGRKKSLESMNLLRQKKLKLK